MWCEAEGCQHLGKGAYQFERPKDWLGKAAPFLNLAAGVLKTAWAVATPLLNLFLGDGAF